MEIRQQAQPVRSPVAMPKRKAPSPTINVTNNARKGKIEILSDAKA
jgi:hypothetical protein